MVYLIKKMDGNIYQLRANLKKEDMPMVTYVQMSLKIYKKHYVF